MISDSTVTDNTAISSGGGLYNFRGTAMLTNCTVSGNSVVVTAAAACSHDLARPR